MKPPTTPYAEAGVWIDAPSATVWATVADIAKLGHYSPETTHTEWLDGSEHHRVGAEFRGHNHNGTNGWHTDCVIVAYDKPTTFAFGVRSHDGYATTWTYTLRELDGGTHLTEAFASPILLDPPTGMDPVRAEVMAEMLNATLLNIKTDIEGSNPPKPAPAARNRKEQP